MKKLEILKMGPAIAKNGTHFNFSENDLRSMAAVYSPALFRAPLVIGHPSEQAPAYGYVKALSYVSGKLLAEPAQVATEFSEMVNSGKLLSLSASFYSPDAPGNPKPGTFYLRHLGFLGAWPPAIKGLAAPEFGDGGFGTIEFADTTSIHPWNLTRYV